MTSACSNKEPGPILLRATAGVCSYAALSHELQMCVCVCVCVYVSSPSTASILFPVITSFALARLRALGASERGEIVASYRAPGLPRPKGHRFKSHLSPICHGRAAGPNKASPIGKGWHEAHWSQAARENHRRGREAARAWRWPTGAWFLLEELSRRGVWGQRRVGIRRICFCSFTAKRVLMATHGTSLGVLLLPRL